MKKLCIALALLLALCACACAETAAPALTAEDLAGLWNLEYVTAAGFMVQAAAYDIVATLNLQEDGSAEMDINGESGDPMSWYIQDGRAYISGYNDDESDVELLLSESGVLEITDAIGSMYFTRPVEEAA